MSLFGEKIIHMISAITVPLIYQYFSTIKFRFTSEMFHNSHKNNFVKPHFMSVGMVISYTNLHGIYFVNMDQ
jgi:hypothetical protein